MTERISAADQLVILLRQRLAEHGQARRKTTPGRSAAAGPPAAPAHAIRAIAGAEGLGDRALKRAIVQNLLAEQFGTGLINEAQFQQMVEKVTDTLVDHQRGAELLDRLVGEMRGG